MMTKNNYKVIAVIISGLTDERHRIDKETLIQRLSDYFRRDNPNFDANGFYKACTTVFPGGVA